MPTAESTQRSVVSIFDNMSMPAQWSSSDDGETFEWGDYLCIFQTDPEYMVSVAARKGLLPKESAPKMIAHLKSGGLRYHFALFCYWKKGRNPEGRDSRLPALIYTIETSKFAPNPMFCSFTPNGRWNNGDLHGPLTAGNVQVEFFKRLTKGHADEVKRLGTMAVGYEIKTGEKWKPQSSGCLGAILLLLSVPSVLLALLVMSVW